MFLTFGLSGCITKVWETSYKDVVSRSAAQSWKAVGLDVVVPQSLSVSDVDRLAPFADIVWHGDPEGDRRSQVKKMLETSLRQAANNLRGDFPVRLQIELEEFHALSDRARLYAPSGVHNISFKIRVYNAETGRLLVPSDRVRADLLAYTGAKALWAERNGQSQKVRITRHIESVIRGWLQQGPDLRESFMTFGL